MQKASGWRAAHPLLAQGARTMTSRLLDVENLQVYSPVRRGELSRTAGYVHAVDGVSLHFAAGETLGIVGESECGKTTIGMAVRRLIEPTGGRVSFEGVDIATLDRARGPPCASACRSSLVPYSSINPRITVWHSLSATQ